MRGDESKLCAYNTSVLVKETKTRGNAFPCALLFLRRMLSFSALANVDVPEIFEQPEYDTWGPPEFCLSRGSSVSVFLRLDEAV